MGEEAGAAGIGWMVMVMVMVDLGWMGGVLREKEKMGMGPMEHWTE
jgi:hypothetical protein